MLIYPGKPICTGLIARNPQTFVPNPYKAADSDYAKATHSVFSDSFLDVELLPATPPAQ